MIHSMAGTPEICLYLLAFGQLARRYAIPYRGGGLLTGSKTCDYQAGVEGSAGLFSSFLGGSHFLFHAGGWLEGGLTVDPVKLALDLEELRKMMRLQQGLDLQHFDAANARLRRSGPAARHSLESDAYRPAFADYAAYDRWLTAGQPTAHSEAARAARLSMEGGADALPLPAGRLSLVDAFIRRREEDLATIRHYVRPD